MNELVIALGWAGMYGVMAAWPATAQPMMLPIAASAITPYMPAQPRAMTSSFIRLPPFF